jgi:hypothetical protein
VGWLADAGLERERGCSWLLLSLTYVPLCAPLGL